MTKDAFLLRLQEEVQIEQTLKETDILEDIPEWDSLAMLAVLSVFDENGSSIEVSELDECKSIHDILKKAGF